MIDKLRANHPNVVLVDCGDTYAREYNHPQLRADAVLSGMKLMNYDAVNIGEGELSLGAEYFRQQARGKNLPFISANITVAGDTAPMGPAYVIKIVKGLKVGITGISGAAFFDAAKVKAEGVVIEDPLKRLNAVVTELRNNKVDVVILLSHLSYEGTKSLLTLNTVEGVDVAIAGHGNKMLSIPEKIGNTVLVQNSMIGEYLGKLQVRIGKDGKIAGYEGELIELTEDQPSNPDAFAIMQAFLSDKVKEDERLRAEKAQKKQSEENGEVLKMSPGEFMEMMKKKNAEEMQKSGFSGGAPPGKQP
ncbi:MAG: hypothetical protein V2B19_32825 [Pseudomonadota bacterium]